MLAADLPCSHCWLRALEGWHLLWMGIKYRGLSFIVAKWSFTWISSVYYEKIFISLSNKEAQKHQPFSCNEMESCNSCCFMGCSPKVAQICKITSSLLSASFYLQNPFKNLNSMKMPVWGSEALCFRLEWIWNLHVNVSVRVLISSFITAVHVDLANISWYEVALSCFCNGGKWKTVYLGSESGSGGALLHSSCVQALSFNYKPIILPWKVRKFGIRYIVWVQVLMKGVILVAMALKPPSRSCSPVLAVLMVGKHLCFWIQVRNIHC